MKVLVTGVNGLLGQHILPLFSSDPDIELYATGLNTNRNPSGNYSYVGCDLTDFEEVTKMVSHVSPDYIIHAAAKTQVDWCEENKTLCRKNNVDATKYLLENAIQSGCHFQYISTDFVFDGKRGNYSENDKPDPVNYYGVSKLEAEALVKSSSNPWSIIRTSLVYGVARDLTRSNIITWIWKNLKAKKKINVVTDQVRTPTFVEDLALGAYLILKKQAEGIFHISGEEILTPFEMARRIANIFMLDANLIKPVDASTFTQSGLRPENTSLLIKKAVENLGYHPTRFNDCIESLEDSLQNYSA